MGYDFEFNDSLYKVITMKTTNCKAAEAVCRTLGVFYGSGHLVEIDSEEELIALSAELKVRHLGSQFEYWVGGDPTGNLTYDNLLREPNEGNSNFFFFEKIFSNPHRTKKKDKKRDRVQTKYKILQ